jgi:hypothetical protein
MMARSLCIYSILAWLASSTANAEIAATSHLGFALRNVSYTETVGVLPGQSTPVGGAASDTFSGPMLCQEVSAAAGLRTAFVSGGCTLVGGFWTFVHATTMTLGLHYFPNRSIPAVAKDDSLRLNQQSPSSLYFAGYAGVAKVTHSQFENSTATLVSDIFELGPGAGYQYKIGDSTTIGVDGRFTFGMILSSAASGTSFGIQVTPNIRVVF